MASTGRQRHRHRQHLPSRSGLSLILKWRRGPYWRPKTPKWASASVFFFLSVVFSNFHAFPTPKRRHKPPKKEAFRGHRAHPSNLRGTLLVPVAAPATCFTCVQGGSPALTLWASKTRNGPFLSHFSVWEVWRPTFGAGASRNEPVFSLFVPSG